jgi:hypothetical protein
LSTAMVLGATSDGVTARFWSCWAPTLLAGGRLTAYDVPPSATSRATRTRRSPATVGGDRDES